MLERFALELWDRTTSGLKGQLNPWDFSQWIQPAVCHQIDQDRGELVLSVPDQSHAQWLTEHFEAKILAALAQAGAPHLRLRFITYDDLADPRAVASLPAVTIASDLPMAQSIQPPPRLNPRYRFESFVDGPTNQFAMSTARAVADQPGLRYNPLFIFGGAGLGKTHLLHAIGNAVYERNPTIRVHYVTSETFVNDLIQSIRTDRMQAFRARYRDACDVLLVDDIQFIAGKDRTQEEFFHLFNELHSSSKQIVMTSDQLPNSIPDLEDRLRSRLSWGLTADIKPPGFETRVAILKTKAESEGLDLPDDIAMFVARHVTQNVRQLEGALLKLVASQQLYARPLDLAMAESALGALVGDCLIQVAPDAILKAVASEFKVSVADLKGERRHRSITVPRQMGMYLVRELTGQSLPQIGQLFGGRDHSTVINALKRVEAMRDANPEARHQLERIRRVVKDT